MSSLPGIEKPYPLDLVYLNVLKFILKEYPRSEQLKNAPLVEFAGA